MRAPTEPPKRTNRMTMKLPSIQPDLVAAPQHPRHVKEARNRGRMRLRMAMMIGMDISNGRSNDCSNCNRNDFWIRIAMMIIW